MRNIVILGAPGAGKGTQAAKLVEALKIVHISTGDLLRKNVAEKTPTGVKAKEFMDAGKLVPDVAVIQMIKDRLTAKDCKNGCLFDGFPRTVAQAEALDRVVKIDAAVNIDVAHEKLMSRLTGRRVCSKCADTYHVSVHKSDSCSKCGGALIQRGDDNEEVIEKRLSVYNSQTLPLIKYYADKKLLVSVDGAQAVGDVYKQIAEALKI